MATGLEGVRVLEVTERVSGAYASKLLADLGADTIKVEPPEGDPARRRGPFAADTDPEASGAFHYLNTNKRSRCLDLTTAEGQHALRALAEDADIVVTDLGPAPQEAVGVDGATLLRTRPDLVVLSITPFGLTGPRADWAAEELTLGHAGGWGWLTPGALDDPDLPPLKVFGSQAQVQTAIAGAAAASATLRSARRTGVGEHIDLSVQSYVASMLEAAFLGYSYTGISADRHGARGLNPWRIFDCADGRIFLVTPEEDQWQRLVEMMGNPDWAAMEVFESFAARMESADALHLLIEQWIADKTVDELFHEGQKRRICFAPVLTMADMEHDEHLAARGFLVDVDHPVVGTVTHLGAPYRLPDQSWSIRRPAPLLDQHSGASFGPRPEVESVSRSGSGGAPARPLDGVRVVDLSWVWAGPFATMHLAHLGAEVIKVESATRLDLGRRLHIVSPPDMEHGPDTCGYFNQWAQGKKSLQVNLSTAQGRRIVTELVADSDVVFANYGAGVLERLGLGYEQLREVREDIILATISGFGHTGPYASYMGYGPTTGPLSGLSGLTGYDDGVPRELGVSLGDPASGITAAFAVCASLLARDQTGRGGHVDVALWEATAATVGEGWMAHALGAEPLAPMGNRDPLMAPHGCFPCDGEDSWVAIACATDEQWSAFAGVVAPELREDPRFATQLGRKAYEDELDAVVGAWTSMRDRWEVTAALQAVGVPAFPSMSPADLAGDEHLEARGFFTRLEHPVVGVRAHTGIPWLNTNRPNGVVSPAPLLGQHTDEVLSEVLGYSAEQIARLRDDGVLR